MNKYPQYGYTITMWSTKSIIFLFFSWGRFSVSYTHVSSYSFNEKRQVIKDIVSYNPPITFRATLLAA